MLIPPPKGKFDLTFSFVWVIIISNIITVAVCFLFLNTLGESYPSTRQPHYPSSSWCLIYLGAFAEKNAFEDMLSRPFLRRPGLGHGENWNGRGRRCCWDLVLGPLAENRLFLATDNYGSGMAWRPGVLIIFAVTLSRHSLSAHQKEKGGQGASRLHNPSSGRYRSSPDRAGSRFSPARRLYGLSLSILLALALWQSRNFGVRAGLFPWVIGTPTLLLALFQLAKDL